jgi:peptidyl-prolyl cis-trans isomerase SurA
MRQIFFAFALILSCPVLVSAQPSKSQILMTIAGEDITTGDFLKVYNKNLDLVLDKDQKDFDHYLDLFINYKLKLAEAKAQGYDRKDSYLKEFKMYKNQLSNAYMTDKKVSESLLKEAYNRTISEVKAQHILVRLEPGQDTLQAYNSIQSLKPRLMQEDFSELKKELHDGKSIFVEDLGYFSAFKMVYDFENAAFDTPVGSVSEPFRTQFGYHVVKVLDKRPSRGQVEVAHIMISNSKKDSTIIPKKRIAELHRLVIQGDSFEDLAKQFSDDKSSAMKGGLLRPFKSGEINSETFVEAAFSLSDIGDISPPIQTQFGWHIIKLISKRPVEDFETLRPRLEQSVKRDSRSQIIRKNTINSLKSRYEITAPNPEHFDQYFKLTDNGWSVDENKVESPFLTIENESVSHKDFLIHLNKIKKRGNNSINLSEFLRQQYTIFLDQKLWDYKKNHLIEDNLEYAEVLQEYQDGLLLFDLMQDNIWEAAKTDSLGLSQYYQSNPGLFTSAEQIVGTIVRSSQKRPLKLVQKMWAKGLDNQAIAKKLNKKEQLIIISTGAFGVDNPLLPERPKFNTGVSEIIPNGDGFVLLRVSSVLPKEILPLDQVKGQVISYYQKDLETQWIEALRQKFKVLLYDEVIQHLKQTLE